MDEPQLAVNVHGLQWWIHDCGAVYPATDPGAGCLACGFSTPWRRLLVERAPEQHETSEPRRWPKIDSPPADLGAVRGASGRVYFRVSQYGLTFREIGGNPRPFSEVQRLDGPLEEVFG